MSLLVNGSVRGVGAEWQGVGNAQPEHGEVWTEAAKSRFSARPRGWTRLVVQRRNFAAKFCSEILSVHFTTDPPVGLHRKFHRSCVQKNLVCHGLLLERLEEVNPENSTTRFRDREVGERQGGCGIYRVGSGRHCKVSLRSLSRERMAVALGQSTYFLRTLGLLGLQLMGINFKVPIACKLSDENCKPALMDSCICFRGEGLQTQKEKTEKNYTAKLCTLPARGKCPNCPPDWLGGQRPSHMWRSVWSCCVTNHGIAQAWDQFDFVVFLWSCLVCQFWLFEFFLALVGCWSFDGFGLEVRWSNICSFPLLVLFRVFVFAMLFLPSLVLLCDPFLNFKADV